MYNALEKFTMIFSSKLYLKTIIKISQEAFQNETRMERFCRRQVGK